ncbi:catechol O-methyltransferase-like isoform X2 [Branchiostoma floridae]|uniref:catechol O-methyltransferase n=1 Tax=Branchiostoma floridae TaxID=7739 RepID=A0A9J7KG80_BRAFL|nr:catechol O-methyltransferase-like isoform X2 [Branchiostoma floridae]
MTALSLDTTKSVHSCKKQSVSHGLKLQTHPTKSHIKMESTTSAVLSAVTGTVAMTAAYAYAQRDWLKDQWLAFISPAIYNFLKGTTREQRALKYLKEHARQGDPDSVLETFDEFCRTQEWAMNAAEEKGDILDEIVRELQPTTCLELGTYCGYSAVRIARNLSPSARLITIEVNPDYAAVAREVVKLAGLQDKIEVINLDSADVIRELKTKYDVTKLDLVFLDHWKYLYIRDIKLIEEEKLLKKGSVVFADNVIIPGAPGYLEYIRGSKNYKSTFYSVHFEYMDDMKDGVEKSVYIGDE